MAADAKAGEQVPEPMATFWPRRTASVGTATVLLVAVSGLTWSKWLPYFGRVRQIVASGAYTSPPATYVGATVGLASPMQAWHFTVTYVLSIWPALVTALVIGAAASTLLPRSWIALPAGGRSGIRGNLMASLFALPCMMCTCCSAPVAVALRRRGAPSAQVTAFWLANPLLNPAVVVFMALLLPWGYVLLRVAAGAALVLGLSWLAGRLSSPWAPGFTTATVVAGTPPRRAREGLRQAAEGLARLAILLVPEYLLVVFVVGLVEPAIPGFVRGAAGPAAVAGLAMAATLFVIPTGAEIPLVMGALAAGFNAGVISLLLIALPAISAPSMVMMRRALGTWPVVWLGALVALSSFGIALFVDALRL